jgi:uncharacterized membrane protein YjjB (DUF3815 family)
VLGGILTTVIFDLCFAHFSMYFIAAVLSSCFMALYSEISAKIFKAPAILFISPCAIPIVPGRHLYYTGYNLITKNTSLALSYANNTFQIALGIAIGMAIASIIMSITLQFIKLVKRK